MQVSIIQAILIGCVYYLGANGTPWFTVNLGWAFRRPLLQGTAVGIVLGDPVTGCIVGAAINVIYLAQVTAGGAQTMDEGLAGTLGAAIAIISGLDAEAAVALAVPISLLGNILWTIYMTGDSFIVHRMDALAEKGDARALCIWNVAPSQIFKIILYVIPVAFAVYAGADAITGLVATLQGSIVNDCLTTIGTIFPAIGIAINFRAILNSSGNKVYLYFLIGFVLYAYLSLPLVAISVIAICVAFLNTSDGTEVPTTE